MCTYKQSGLHAFSVHVCKLVAHGKDNVVFNHSSSLGGLQPYLVHFSVVLPDAWPLMPPPAERRNLMPHVAGSRRSSIVHGRQSLWRWRVHEGVISKEGGLVMVGVGGGGGSLSRAMHGLEGSGSRLGGGQV